MIVALIVITTLIVVIYIVAGIEVSKAAVAVAHQDDPNLQQAHKYLSWATSITWISVGLIIIGLVILLIGGIFLAPEIAIADAIAIAAVSMKAKVQELEDEKKKAEKGFLGVQSLNDMGGFVGGSFKLIFFGTLLLITTVGALSLVGWIYIRKSGTDIGKRNAFVATVLALSPIILIVFLEIINAVYVNKHKKEVAEIKRELYEEKKKLINKKLELDAMKPPKPVAPVVVVPPSSTPAATVPKAVV